VAIILIIAAIAIPNLLRARIAANDSAAVATVRNLNNSQATYIINFASFGYADTLVKLGPGNPCDQTHACLVDELLACAGPPCIKSGYEFSMTPGIEVPVASYTFSVTPHAFGGTGDKNYCGVEDGIIRQALTATAKVPPVAHLICTDTTKYTAVQ